MSTNMKIEKLLKMLASIDNTEDFKALMEDLCTTKELENMAERCYAAQLLMDGLTYNQVMSLSNISSATLSRVSRCVQYGKGYSRVLKK